MPMQHGHVRIPLEERFWAKVEKTDEHWLWTGAVNGKGYGHIFDSGKVRTAHRVGYELQFGPIAEGLVPDHTCENKLCVRHLELVTQAENARRWFANHPTPLCRKGLHADTEENTGRQPNGARYCKGCRNARQRRSQ